MKEKPLLEPQIDAAFEYAFPLYEMARTRYRAVQDPSNPHRHPANTVRHQRSLSDHQSRWITSPNNDTLYSNSWLDCASGPVHIRVGAMPPGRYWSLAFLDVFTDHFAIVGQRPDATGPIDLWVTAPGKQCEAPPGRVIEAPGNDAWLFIRCLVDGPDDVANSHAMQDQIDIAASAPSSEALRVVPTSSHDPANFLAVVNELLGRNVPPAVERLPSNEWAAVGLRPGVVDAWSHLGECERSTWTSRIGPLHAKLRQASAKGRREMQGWFASAAEMGDFGRNFALRASVALGGLGALPQQEAMYFVGFDDSDKQPLDGRHCYTLHVPPRGIPCDSFWSFSMYEPTSEGQRFFVENPIRRYSIGNRTRGLVRNDDGSLDILLQHRMPESEKLRANWLPAPRGAFQIALRAYLPRRELREGCAAMPTIVRQPERLP